MSTTDAPRANSDDRRIDPTRLSLDHPLEGRLDVHLRLARAGDVDGIRALLADDVLGAKREALADATLERYRDAFTTIDADPRNELWVVCREHAGAVLSGAALPGAALPGAVAPEAEPLEEVVGTYQVTYIPYLSRGGNERAHIEAVRVASALRGLGLGRWMMRHALAEARRRGCLLAQLTSDKTRTDARRFYERLGFRASHVGMKLELADPVLR